MVKHLLILLSFLPFVLPAPQAKGANYYARANGNWNSSTTWTTSAYVASGTSCTGLLLLSGHPGGGAGVPGAGDNVYIAASFTVTVTAAASCNSLTLGNGMYIWGTTCLLGAYSTSTNPNGTLVINSGQSVTTSALTLNNGGTVTNNGTLQVNGNSVLNGGSTGSVLTVGGTVNNTGTVTINSGTVNGQVLFSGSARTLTIGGALTNAGTINMSGGSSNHIMSLGSSWTNNGTFTCGTGTVTLTNAAAASLGGNANITFYKLYKTGAGTTTLSLPATTNQIVVNNEMNLSAGIFDCSVYDLTGTAGLVMSGSSELHLAHVEASSGPLVPKLDGTAMAYSLTGNSKVRIYAAAATGIRNYYAASSLITYRNLEVASSGSKFVKGNMDIDGTLYINNTTLRFPAAYQVNLSGNLQVDGGSASITNYTGCTLYLDGTTVVSGTTASIGTLYNLQIAAGSSLTASTAIISVAGNFINDGTFTHGSGEIEFSGSAGNTPTISGTQITGFNNFKVTGTVWSHASQVNIVGNYTNNGTFNHNNGTVSFNGSGAQSLGGTSATTFNNVIVNNTGSGVTLSQNASLSGLTLTNGALSLNAKTLTVANSSTAAVSRSNGYIISEDLTLTGGRANNQSKVQWNTTGTGSFVFPFGSLSGVYIPVTVNVTSGNAGNITVATYVTAANNTPYPINVSNVGDYTLTNVNNSANTVDRFWEMTKTGGTSTSTLTFTYTDAEIPAAGETGSDGQGLRAQYWNGTMWPLPMAGQTATAAANTVTVAGVTNIAVPWALALNVSPLPVSLLDFGAEWVSGKVLVSWLTASELNNDYFTIERSTDGISYGAIASIKGAGNSQTALNYQYFDMKPLARGAYYRLKQTDFNGEVTYFKPVFVRRASGNSALSVYPNPSNGTDVFIQAVLEEPSVLKIFNAAGVLVHSWELDGEGDIRFNLSTGAYLAPGVYFVQLTSGSEAETKKLIIK